MSSESHEIVAVLPKSPELGRYAAAALVFGTSASVLVIEVVALRLLAPYLGLTLETSTLVIGIALAAIAMGCWAGGRVADLMPPRRALGPLLAVSGVAVAATPFAVRAAGAFENGLPLMIVSTFAIMVPGTLLAAVTPMVTKLRLTSLNETRNGRRKTFCNRDYWGHRRHPRDRFRPDLTPACQRHPGRTWGHSRSRRGFG